MPHARSVSIAIFIGAGSRYEAADKAGVFHFIEHLCFRGTLKRSTAREISEAIEGVGGVLNGGTDKELTLYWIKVPVAHFPLAMDVLADIIRCSKFDVEDVNKERQIIMEEINLSNDSPSDRVSYLIDEVLWPDHPLGRDPAGSKETVSAISRSDILDHVGSQYLSNSTVVSIAGDIPHDDVVCAVEKVFADWQPNDIQSWQPASDVQSEPRLCIECRETEQTHLCLAVKGWPLNHPDRYNLDMLNVILGEGMSSRLFAEIRDRRGLAYVVNSGVEHFQDSGAVVIYAGVARELVYEAVSAILDQLNQMKDGIPEAEMIKAREMSKGRLLLRMEDTYGMARWLGAQELLTGKILTEEEVLSIVDSIQVQDVQRVAQQLFVTERLSLGIVGPVGDEDRLAKLLRL